MIQVLTVICESKKFVNVNLSWNYLCENPNYANIGSFCDNYQELEGRKSNRKRMKPEQKKSAA